MAEAEAATPASDVGPTNLAEARTLAHWAAQIPAAAASLWVAERDDDSHSNLGWDKAAEALLSHPLSVGPAEIRGSRVGVSLEPLAVVVAPMHGELAITELEGSTLKQGLANARELLATSCGLAVSELPLPTLRDYDMPAHAVARGAVFEEASQRAELAELASWFVALDGILAVFGVELGANRLVTEVTAARVWPHHFDLGLLASLREGQGIDSIGVGMSPGDETFDQPYLYVNAYPWPEPFVPRGSELPPGAFWNDRGFHGAALLGETVVKLGVEERNDFAAGFLEAAVRALLG